MKIIFKDRGSRFIQGPRIEIVIILVKTLLQIWDFGIFQSRLPMKSVIPGSFNAFSRPGHSVEPAIPVLLQVFSSRDLRSRIGIVS